MLDDQSALIKEFQNKYAKKLRENEIDSLTYWKEQVDRIISMKPEGVAALQTHIKKISGMMENRISTLKRQQ